MSVLAYCYMVSERNTLYSYETGTGIVFFPPPGLLLIRGPSSDNLSPKISSLPDLGFSGGVHTYTCPPPARLPTSVHVIYYIYIYTYEYMYKPLFLRARQWEMTVLACIRTRGNPSSLGRYADKNRESFVARDT